MMTLPSQQLEIAHSILQAEEKFFSSSDSSGSENDAIPTTVLQEPPAYLDFCDFDTAAVTSLVSGESSPLVKQELRWAILNKCISKGKTNILPEYKKPAPEKLSPEEFSKRKERRERNKIAARKCRQKRRDISQKIILVSQRLESENTMLEYELRRLKKEKKRLKTFLLDHVRTCDKVPVTQDVWEFLNMGDE